MWYFAWVLGVSFAASLAILNAMWLETVCDIDAGQRRTTPGDDDPGLTDVSDRP